MFRQIRIVEDHSRFQLILWRPTPSSEIETFRLDTVTYGTASAPFLSLRVLHQLAADERVRYPLASSEIMENTYVDDIFFGASNLNLCRDIRDQLMSITQSGGFPLHKWSSNNEALLYDLPVQTRVQSYHIELEEASHLKVLGIRWTPVEDNFSFRVNPDIPPHLTKRSLLSHVAKLYDPLGWLSPVIIVGKILMQQLWLAEVDWDSPLPAELSRRSHDFCQKLILLSEVRVPRWLHTLSNSTIELHGFSDASQSAYAAAVYIRARTEHQITVALLASKSKVAPLKTQSIPRLELCAAELLSRLLEWVINALQEPDVTTYAWTDSTVTLAWIKSQSSRWKVFVANRVSLIQTRGPNVTWRHVPTHDNPADLASRGVLPSMLIDNPLWWRGPDWLSLPSNCWPAELQASDTPPIELEMKPIAVHHNSVDSWSLASRYSDWGKLIKITALVLRFIKLIRKQVSRSSVVYDITIIAEARLFWVKFIQRSIFATELALLQDGKLLPRSSSLKTLDPHLDENGVIRMGGRLANAPLTFGQKHPIILGQAPLTRLLVRHAHHRTLHGGSSLTLRLLQENYWILRAKVIVRSIINYCVICTRHRAELRTQRMAHLPEYRVTVARPFFKVGIDYASPLYVRAFSGRGHKSKKAYIAIFICMATRAIHIELVTDLSTQAFLAAFRRFYSRRGLPASVYSDNGTNFHGAEADLRRLFRANLNNGEVASSMADNEIEWHFIPPSSPHFGGLWEAGVKSIKHHLKRVIGSCTLTIDEFTTLLCQVEACLNSRPIAGLSSGPDDLSYLTPGHFLIGSPLLAMPEPNLLDRNESNLSRYQLVQQLRDRFWKVWRLDYLTSLQKRRIWGDERPNLVVGDLVLIKDDNKPPTFWPLGRIIQCIAGSDGLVRVCEIKTANSVLRRPVAKLCVLPISAAE